MRIWTTQSLSLWNQLQEQGVAYANTAKSLGTGDYKEAYEWMAAQMVKRVGPAPLPEVRFPLWGWQQVGSYKKEYHGSLSVCDGNGEEYVFIAADIPDDQLLLSDFYWWHAVLNHTYADMLKHKNEPDEEAAIIRSWDNIFDLSHSRLLVGIKMLVLTGEEYILKVLPVRHPRQIQMEYKRDIIFI